MKILICDDSQFIRKRLFTILSELNFEIEEAKDGAEALDLITSNNYDLILLDLLMPNVTGKEVLEKMFDDKIKTPVIVLSADIQETTLNYCYEKGAVAFLTKPPKTEELIETVKKVLNL
ncbi:MAG TPA: response regulator [Melioribacteraceae bacterium]|nr:response regulator [Melioribacteraceae bacterium]